MHDSQRSQSPGLLSSFRGKCMYLRKRQKFICTVYKESSSGRSGFRSLLVPDQLGLRPRPSPSFIKHYQNPVNLIKTIVLTLKLCKANGNQLNNCNFVKWGVLTTLISLFISNHSIHFIFLFVFLFVRFSDQSVREWFLEF